MAAQTDDVLRRVPPQNIEAEQSVLGAILLENEAINHALEILTRRISIARLIARFSAR